MARTPPAAQAAGAVAAHTVVCIPRTGALRRAHEGSWQHMEARIYTVPGAACWHRIAELTSRISLLRGVLGVSVDRAGGDEAEFRVVSDGPVSPEGVCAAIREAGFEAAEVVGSETAELATV